MYKQRAEKPLFEENPAPTTDIKPLNRLICHAVLCPATNMSPKMVANTPEALLNEPTGVMAIAALPLTKLEMRLLGAPSVTYTRLAGVTKMPRGDVKPLASVVTGPVPPAITLMEPDIVSEM